MLSTLFISLLFNCLCWPPQLFDLSQGLFVYFYYEVNTIFAIPFQFRKHSSCNLCNPSCSYAQWILEGNPKFCPHNLSELNKKLRLIKFSIMKYLLKINRSSSGVSSWGTISHVLITLINCYWLGLYKS